jgi:hydrogenase/urease accessory protein HupE
LSVPELGFVIATRAMLAAGVGLLLTASLCRKSRRRLGATLLAVGAVTTVPAAFLVFGRREQTRSEDVTAV